MSIDQQLPERMLNDITRVPEKKIHAHAYLREVI